MQAPFSNSSSMAHRTFLVNIMFCRISIFWLKYTNSYGLSSKYRYSVQTFFLFCMWFLAWYGIMKFNYQNNCIWEIALFILIYYNHLLQIIAYLVHGHPTKRDGLSLLISFYFSLDNMTILIRNRDTEIMIT